MVFRKGTLMLHCDQTTTTELQDKCKDDATAKFCKKQKKKSCKKKKVYKKCKKTCKKCDEECKDKKSKKIGRANWDRTSLRAFSLILVKSTIPTYRQASM